MKEEAIKRILLAGPSTCGRKDVESARKFYSDTAMAFMQGKQSPYTKGFVFEVAKGGTADPDKPTMRDVASSSQDDQPREQR